MLMPCIIVVTVSLPGSAPMTAVMPNCEQVEKSIRHEMRKSHGLEGLLAYDTDLIKRRIYRSKK